MKKVVRYFAHQFSCPHKKMVPEVIQTAKTQLLHLIGALDPGGS